MMHQIENKLNNRFQLPLSNEETDKYLGLLNTGDENAAEILIEHNLRLVAYIALKYETVTYNNSYIELNDLINIGTIGLIKAIRSFNINKNIKLTTYASRCIENEILMFLRSNKKLALTVSLETILNEDNDGNKITIKDTLSSEENIEDSYIEKEIYKRIKEQLANLNTLEKRIIYMRFELKLSQQKVADTLHLSKTYVHKIESKVRKKIVENLQKEGLFYAKKVTNEIKKVIDMKMEDKALYLANIFINTNTTIDGLAIKYNISKGTIYYYFRQVLKKIDPPSYDKVLNILNEQNIQKTKKHK
jgi:RNA polymerase sporulation-specific sigma factor